MRIYSALDFSATTIIIIVILSLNKSNKICYAHSSCNPTKLNAAAKQILASDHNFGLIQMMHAVFSASAMNCEFRNLRFNAMRVYSVALFIIKSHVDP